MLNHSLITNRPPRLFSKKLFFLRVVRVEGSSSDVLDKEVASLSDLTKGEVRRGFVVSSGNVGVLVRLVDATDDARYRVGVLFRHSLNILGTV